MLQDNEHELDEELHVEEYKGKPILVLNFGQPFPFKFGLSKARLILDNVEKIKKFVKKYGKKNE